MKSSPVVSGMSVDLFIRARAEAWPRKNRLRMGAMRAAWAALGAVCLMAAGAQAQTAQFSGWESTVQSAVSSDPVAVAVDASGNVYVSESSPDQVLKFTPSGNGYTQTTVANSSNGLVNPAGIAVDGSGNVFIADYGSSSGQILEATPSGLSYNVSALSLTGAPATFHPLDVAVDPSGNVYFTNNADANVYIDAAGTVSTLTLSPTAPTLPLGLAWETTGANTGNLFISDSTGNQVIEAPITSGAAGTTAAVTGTTLSSPARIAVGSTGNLYVADAGNSRIVEIPWTGSAWGAQIVVPSSTLSGPEGVAVDSRSSVYIADTGNNRTIGELQSAASLGSVAVGSTSSPVTLWFTFTGSGTLSSTAVLTQGKGGLDFADAGTGTCAAGSYSAGQSCSIQVTFTPAVSGARYGAATLVAGGNVIATAYLDGNGSGPQISFAPASGTGTPLSEVTLDGAGVNSDTPNGIAVDAAGNIYLSETANSIGSNEVVKLAAGTYTQTVVASGLGYPDGVAVDGAGNVYIADAGCALVQPACQGASPSGQLYKVSWNGSSYGSKQPLLAANTHAPAGVAVDASGDVLFTEGLVGGSPYVGEIPLGGNLTQLTQFTGTQFAAPSGLAFDASGNLFVTDSQWAAASSGAPVWELQKSSLGWSGSATQAITSIPVVNSNPSVPSGIVLDANEDIFLADFNQHSVYKFPWAGSAWGAQTTVPTSTLDTTAGVALDGSGNLYVTECNCDTYSHSRAFQEKYSTAPTLNFASTQVNSGNSSDSPQTVTISNIGNLQLTFSDSFSSTNFAKTGSSSCGSSATLTAGTNSCTLGFDFAPTVTGADSYSLLLTDNNLNVPGATQTIAMNGTGTGVATIAVTTPATVTAGQAFVVTIKALDSNNNVVTGYNGTVTLVSTDGHISPSSYTLLNGMASFLVTLQTAESQTITATDSVHSYITGVSSSITVNPGPVTQLVVGTPVPPSPEVAGAPFTIAVTAEDAYGNTETANTDAITFTSTDASAVLPSGALTAGSASFGFTLKTEGTQTITATDASSHLSATTPSIMVGPGPATTLAAISGRLQFALVNQTFLAPLTVKVTDANGNAVSGILVSFTPPGSGASATLSAPNCTTSIAGTCSVTATANSTANPNPTVPYIVGASTVSPSLGVAFSLTNASYAVNPFGVGAAVGTTSSAQPVTVVFTASGTLESINVLTDGVPGGDFASVTGGTCTIGTSYTAGQACSVNVTFTPKYSGERFGAVVLQDDNNNVLGTEFLDPIGEGPQIVYEPGMQSTMAIVGSVTAQPVAVATDGAQDVFVSDSANSQIVEEVRQNNGYTQVTVASGITGASGVAVDGAGNVYFSGTNQVYKAVWNGVAYGTPEPLLAASPVYLPTSVAVDAFGNLYFVNNTGSDHNVYEIQVSGQAANASTVITLATSAVQPSGLAFDAQGDMFVADSAGNQIYELPWTGTGYATPGFSLALTSVLHPSGIALDGGSNLYIAAQGGNQILKALFNGSSWNTPVTEDVSSQLTPSTLFVPNGIAVDQAGNLYIADSGNNRLIKDDRADIPSLNFDTTELYGTSADSPQTVTLENIGNQTLQFTASGVSFPTDFPVGLAPSTPNQACINSLALTPTTPNAGILTSFCQLVIDFIPTQAGNPVNYNENLTLTDNNLEVTNATQSIKLTGESYPQLYLKPDSVNFGNQPQGSTSNSWTMTLENEGNAQITNINLQFINLTGEDADNSTPFTPSPNPFSIVSNTCGWSVGHPFTLNSYQDCTIQVVFTPQLTGHNADSYTAQLEVTDSASAATPLNPVVSNFSGTGSGQPIFLSPNAITFSNQTAGSTSNPWTVTVNNVSSAPISISSIALTGLDPSDFGFTTDCGSSLPYTVPAYSNCRLFVTFNPASNAATGTPLTATLQVTNTGSPTPLSLPLTGTANPLSATLAPNNLNFGSQAQGSPSSDSVATLTNNGDGVLDISSFSITAGSSSYKIDSSATTCGTTLPAHGTCNISVYFDPSNSTSGLVNGTLTVVDGAGTQTTSLTGIATSGGSNGVAFNPGAVTFGNQTVGSSSSPVGVTLSNSGSASVTGVTYLAGTGDTGDFSFVPNTYPAACGATLANGSSCPFQVVFTPQATGTRTATFALTYPGCSGTCTVALTLTGTGTVPTATVSPNSQNFGTVADGTSSTPDLLLTVTNTSSGPVTIASPSGIAVSSPFVWDSTSPSNTCLLGGTLSGGQACQIAVYFHPTASGNQTGNATVTLNYTGGSVVLHASLTGVGGAPNVVFSTNSLAFGNVTVGSSSTLSLVVTNSGAASIAIATGPTIVGGGGLYTVLSAPAPGGGTCNTAGYTTLQASGSSGDTCTIVVQYTPTAVGAAPTPASVQLNLAGVGSPLSANLTGNGTAPAVVVTPNPVNFGNITIGTTSPVLTATLTNNSNVTVQYGLGSALSAPFINQGGTCTATGTLAASASCTISYQFLPTTVGNSTQVVTVNLADGPGYTNTLPSVAATFTGAGVLATGTLSPSSLIFPDVFVNLSDALQVTVTNTSGTALTVGNITPASGVFAASSNCTGQTLSANGGQCTFSVTFAPNAAGNANGSLTVPLTYACTPGPTCSIILTQSLFGQGDAPSISVSPSSLNFGNVVYKTGPTTAQKVTIMNTATGPINISSIAINPALVGDGFQITSNTCPATLNAGVSCYVYVDFNPQNAASYSGQLIINDNALNSPQAVILSGAGVNKTTPSMSVNCVSNPINYGQNAICSAYLSSSNNGDTVTFSARVHGNGPFNIPLGTGTVATGVASSPASPGFSALANGTYDVEAVYNGNSQNTTATATTTETINAITPTVTLNCLPGTAAWGASSTCTAKVNDSAPNGSTVTFYWQPQSASSFTYLSTGTLTSGSATTTVGGGAPFTAGSYVIEAVYAGATGYAGGETATASFVVTQITPTITSLPTLSGTLDTGAQVGSVGLTGGCVSAPGFTCSPAGLPGSFIWTNPTDTYSAAGTHSESVTFVPTDSTDYASVTGTISFSVVAPLVVIHSGHYSLLAYPASLTLAAGQTGTVKLTMVPSGGFTGTVNLSCSGLPAGVNCGFAPATLVADGHGATQTSVLTVSTQGLSASLTPAPGKDPGGSTLAGILMLPGLLCGGFLAWRRKRFSRLTRQLLVLAIIASALAGFVGCGGSAQFANTLNGTHTVTLTAKATSASAGTSTDSGTFTLTITQ